MSVLLRYKNIWGPNLRDYVSLILFLLSMENLSFETG